MLQGGLGPRLLYPVPMTKQSKVDGVTWDTEVTWDTPLLYGGEEGLQSQTWYTC